MRSNMACLAAALLGLCLGTSSARSEIVYPWCAQYADRDGGPQAPGIVFVMDGTGGRNCGFWTLEQCRAAVMGNGGQCEPNPMYVPGRDGAVRQPRRAR